MQCPQVIIEEIIMGLKTVEDIKRWMAKHQSALPVAATRR